MLAVNKQRLEFMGTVDLPLIAGCLSAGFGSPADDYIESALCLRSLLLPSPASTEVVRSYGGQLSISQAVLFDPNKELVIKRIATMVFRVVGTSMIGSYIRDGDIILVDRSLSVRSGDVSVATIGGEFLVKRFRQDAAGIRLESDNSAYPPRIVREFEDFEVIGPVTYSIHQHYRR